MSGSLYIFLPFGFLRYLNPRCTVSIRGIDSYGGPCKNKIRLQLVCTVLDPTGNEFWCFRRFKGSVTKYKGFYARLRPCGKRNWVNSADISIYLKRGKLSFFFTGFPRICFYIQKSKHVYKTA